VYGCRGLSNKLEVSADSTISPRYMTATRRLICLTELRSCEMYRYEYSLSLCKSMSRFSICALIETSNEETGSSHTINFGFTAIALAIAIRCRWPPLNSCG